MTLVKKKHKQWILAIDASYVRSFMFENFSTFPLEKFISGGNHTSDLASALVLRERHWLEHDKDYLQPLNYITLKQAVVQPSVNREGGFCSLARENFYSTYYRKKGVGEDRLADKMSNGWGGHTDWNMVIWDNDGAPDFLATARNNIIIELSQELKMRFVGTDVECFAEALFRTGLKFKGFIFDPSDDVGQHHLALCWELEIPESVTIDSREDEQKLGPWCNASELVTQKTERPGLYENWSNIVIDAIADGTWEKSEAGQFAVRLDGVFSDWTEVKNVDIEAGTATTEMNLSLGTPERMVLDLSLADPEEHQPKKLIPLTPAGLTTLPIKTESAIDWTPETSEIDVAAPAADLPVGVWSAQLHNKLKSFGASNDTIDKLVKRTMPGEDLEKLREHAVADLQFTDQGIFAPLAAALEWAQKNPPVDNAEKILATLDEQLAKPDVTTDQLRDALRGVSESSDAAGVDRLSTFGGQR